jgi:hypothetical protein
MGERIFITLSRGFWYCLAATLLWSAIPYGIYMLYVGTTYQGVLCLAIGAGIVVLLLRRQTIPYLEQHRTPRASVYLLLLALAAMSLLQLLYVFPVHPTLGMSAYFPVAHETVLLALVGLTLWQFTRCQARA